MFDYYSPLYGIGLGPGDPELITVKALNILRECEVLILPDSGRAEAILKGILTPEELDIKELIPVHIPMATDSINIESAYSKVVDIICPLLDMNRTVGYLTIGDPTLYSSFSQIKSRLEYNGYKTKIINGIPAFLSAASCTNHVLVYGDEGLSINPSSIDSSDTVIYMKKHNELPDLIHELSDRFDINSLTVFGASDAGLPTQKTYSSITELCNDPPSSYFTTIVVKHNH